MENENLGPKYSGSNNKGIPSEVIMKSARAFKIHLHYTGSREIEQENICKQEQQRIETETDSMKYETSTAVSTACSQSSNSSSITLSITSSNAPDIIPSLPSVQLLHGNICREYSIEDNCYSSIKESTAKIDHRFTSNFELSSKTSLVTNDRLQDLVIFLFEVKKRDTVRATLSSCRKRKSLERHYKPLPSDSNDTIKVEINKKFPKDEKSIFFKMLDQLNLIDLVRTYQSSDQGSFRKAPKPLSRPVDLGLPEEFATEDPWLYSCVWVHRLRFRFSKSHGGSIRHKYTIEIKDVQAPKYNRSHLSNCIRAEDITNVTPSKISIIKTFRNKPCSQSEAYTSLLTRQCEEVNNLIFDTSFLERINSENFLNYDIEETEKEDCCYDDDDDGDDYYYDSDSDDNSDDNSDHDSDSNIEKNYFGLKRLTEFLIGYHQNDSISNKKLCC